MTKAYALLDIEIHDLTEFQEYMKKAQVAIDQAGGRYLVRGGEHKVLEGDWDISRLTVVEFPSVAAAESFYDNDLYKEAKIIRHRSSNSNIVMVEGIANQE